MHKHFLSTNHYYLLPIFLLVLLPATIWAQGPNNSGTYYQAADGNHGRELKTALCAIIYPHTQLSYNALWTAFKTTDLRDDGKIWDMYSGITNYRPGLDQAGNYRVEGDVYNREHSFPKSWFNNAYPMYTDLVHLVPTDGYVNGRRSNYPFGETRGETYTSQGGFSKLGKCTLQGYSGTVFEPNDEYKGDFARIYFYMITCYERQVTAWSCDILSGDTYRAFTTWQMDMLMRWAAEDPVSEKEINRNNAVYTLQGNRNPFVDYPGLEQYIWGELTNTAFSYANYRDPDSVDSVGADAESTGIYTLDGQRVNSISRPGVYIINGVKTIITQL